MEEMERMDMNPENTDRESENREIENQGKMKKSYGRYGLKLVIFTAVTSALQIFGSTILAGLLGVNPNESSWYPFVNILVPMHIIGLVLTFVRKHLTPLHLSVMIDLNISLVNCSL